jgi:hypothetical protein
MPICLFEALRKIRELLHRNFLDDLPQGTALFSLSTQQSSSPEVRHLLLHRGDGLLTENPVDKSGDKWQKLWIKLP